MIGKKCFGELLIFFKNSAKKYQKYMLGIYFIWPDKDRIEIEHVQNVRLEKMTFSKFNF